MKLTDCNVEGTFRQHEHVQHWHLGYPFVMIICVDERKQYQEKIENKIAKMTTTIIITNHKHM